MGVSKHTYTARTHNQKEKQGLAPPHTYTYIGKNEEESGDVYRGRSFLSIRGRGRLFFRLSGFYFLLVIRNSRGCRWRVPRLKTSRATRREQLPMKVKLRRKFTGPLGYIARLRRRSRRCLLMSLRGPEIRRGFILNFTNFTYIGGHK